VQGYQHLPDNDLYGIYIEDETPLADGLDTRAGAWPTEGVAQLEQFTRECLEKYKKRIVSMLAVMRRLVSLEKEFCRATAEEKRRERLADGLQQEVDHLARWSHQQRVSIVWILQPRAW